MPQQTRRIFRQFGEITRREAINLVFGIHERLRGNPQNGGTPVDTGFATNNWIFSVGAPNRELVPLEQPGDQVGLQQIVRWQFIQGPAYITNNASYIGSLNAGSSQQAPAMFVEMAIDREIDVATRRRTLT